MRKLLIQSTQYQNWSGKTTDIEGIFTILSEMYEDNISNHPVYVTQKYKPWFKSKGQLVIKENKI